MGDLIAELQAVVDTHGANLPVYLTDADTGWTVYFDRSDVSVYPNGVWIGHQNYGDISSKTEPSSTPEGAA